MNFTIIHGDFNNSLNSNLRTKAQLERLNSLHDLDLFSLNTNPNIINFDYNIPVTTCHSNYYSPHSFKQLINSHGHSKVSNCLSIVHNNVRSLKRNLENFQTTY